MRKAITNSMFWAVFVSLALAVGIANADIESGLVGHWEFDEGEGTSAEDSSGNENHGTLVGNPQWVEGVIKGALEFNGTDSMVDIPYSPDMTPSEGATMSAWVFPTDTTRSCIVGQLNGYGMALLDGLQLKSVIWGADWVLSDVTIPMEEWSHIAMTWDVANAERMIFLNGELVGQRGDAAVPQVQDNLGIGLWAGWAGGDDSFMGVIDDVRLYGRVLSEEDIVELFEWVGGANAGPDQWVEAGDTVTLEGSGPADATSFAWEQVIIADEPAVTLVNPGDATCTFDSPVRDIGYALTFRLTVESTETGTTTDECLVMARAPNAPKVAPGNLRTVRTDRGFWLYWDPVFDAGSYAIEIEYLPDVWIPVAPNVIPPEYQIKDQNPGAIVPVRVVAKNSHGDGAVSDPVTMTIMRNVALPAPAGDTPPTASFDYDGNPVTALNDGVLDSSTDSYGTAAETEDFWGYTWDEPLFFDEIAYFTGDVFWNGGWFTDLTVEYTEDGATWVKVANVEINPAYDFTDSSEDRDGFLRYEISFMTVRGTGIRIYGAPGGWAAFTSIAELQVYGDQTQGPLIVQGVDADAPEYSTAALDGRCSLSTRGPLSGFAWVQTGGATVAISGADQALASFTAPGVDADTVLTFELTAGDGTETDTDEVSITIKNQVTTSVAGPDEWVYEGTDVTLDGTGSTTTSGNITYSWTQTHGTEATLTGANTATSSFTAPAVWDYNDDLIFQLEVDDGVGPVSTDTITVTVKNLYQFRVKEGLLGHWTFDETEGTTAHDSSGNEINGALQGDPQWVAGKRGGALDFDGAGDYVRIPRIVQDDFTLTALIKTDTPGIMVGGQGYQGSGLMWSDVGGMANDFILAVLGTKLSFFCGNPDLSVNSDLDVVTGDWVHVVATRSAQQQRIGIYIDGKHEKTFDHANSGPLDAQSIIAIGGNVNDSRYYTGLVDEVRIYDRVLSEEEIRKLYEYESVELTDAYALRTLATSYQAGASIDVSVSARANPANPPDTYTVTENIPEGLSVVAGSVTHDGSVGENTITWTLSGGGVTDLAYWLQVPAETSAAVNFGGTVSFGATTVDIYGDSALYAAPTAPLYATLDTTLGITLSWCPPPEEGADAYRVYRSVDGGDWAQVAFTRETFYTEGLVEGSTYSYKVMAVSKTGVEGPFCDATDAMTVTVPTLVEAENYNYGGGLYPGYRECPAANRAPDSDTVGTTEEYDFYFDNTTEGDARNTYRPNDSCAMQEDRVTANIGWITVGDWWRYTLDVPEPGPEDPPDGWARVGLLVASNGTCELYWDEGLVGTVSFATGGSDDFRWYALEDPFRTTPGEHTLRVKFASGAMDIDTIGLGFNQKISREAIFEDDFEDYTNLYDWNDLETVGNWDVTNGSGEPDVGWRLWNTTGDYLGDETEDRHPAIAGMTGNYVISDSDLVGTANLDEELVTPDIDCTEYIRLKLDFGKNFRVYPDDADHSQVAEVDIREVGGGWVNLLSYNVNSIDPNLDPAVDSTPEKLDLSAYDGKTFQLRWHFYDATWDWWWAIDNVMVSGEPKPVPPPPKGVILTVGIAAGKLSVTWGVFGTETYYIDYTADLTGAWSEVAGPLTGTSSSDVGISGSAGFYRVRAE